MPAEALWAKADGITFGNVPRWRASQCVRFITTIGWGLRRPARTATGYRVYGASDFQRLEQIVALEFLGLSLKDIKMLLDRDSRELADVLAAQRSALEDKRRHLDRAIDAIRDAERVIDAGAEPAIAAIRRIIEVIEIENGSDYLKKYYSDETWAKLAERREQWSAQSSLNQPTWSLGPRRRRARRPRHWRLTPCSPCCLLYRATRRRGR